MQHLRPPQPPTPAADAFEIHRAAVDGELSIAFVREGVGGYPLLLIHGFPETKRIWWRNIEPLVQAGYEVIVPDLRGYGDSDLSDADHYELGLYADDLHALVHDVLGHAEVGIIAGDVGGMVGMDLANRHPGWVSRMIFFNTVAPYLPDEADWYAERHLDPNPLPDGPSGDYRIRQGRDSAELIAELDSPERCERYLRDFYEHRLWASPHSFGEEDIAFMAEPFRDIRRLAASWAPYQHAYGRPMTVAPVLGRCPTHTMVLYGRDDQVVSEEFVKRCEIVFPDRIGPIVLPECGHFLQWERADVLNGLAALFFASPRDRRQLT